MAIYPFFAVGVVTLGFLVYQAQRDEFPYNAEWEKNMCKTPYIIKAFVPGMHPKGISGPGVINKCMQRMNENIFNKLIAPIKQILDTFKDVIDSIKKQLASIREAIMSMQKVVFATFDKVFRKLYESFKLIAWLVKRIMTIFIKIFKVYVSIFKIFYGLYLFLSSIRNLIMQIIGGIQKAIKSITGTIDSIKSSLGFCFGKNTFVVMDNDELIEIPYLRIGDKLKNGGRVTAIYKFDTRYATMYELNNDIVDGGHTVLFNGKYIFVNQHPYAQQINNYKHEYIYCVDTEMHKIMTNNNYYLDYIELNNHNTIFSTYYKLKWFEWYCNDGHFNERDAYDMEQYMLVHPETKIRMENNTYKMIKDIMINDTVLYGGKVVGKMMARCNKFIKYKDIMTSPNIWIKDSIELNKWQTINSIGSDYNTNEKFGYYIMTKNSDKKYAFITESGLKIKNIQLDLDDIDENFDINTQQYYNLMMK